MLQTIWKYLCRIPPNKQTALKPIILSNIPPNGRMRAERPTAAKNQIESLSCASVSVCRRKYEVRYTAVFPELKYNPIAK